MGASDDTRAVVVVEDLSKGFHSTGGEPATEILRIPRFDVPAATEVALGGESGSGKTTLLNLLAGLTRPDRGRIRIAGEDIVSMDERGRDRHRAVHVGYVYQAFNLLQGYTALENVELAASLAGGAARERAQEVLVDVGLGDRIHHLPRQLSAGQQQRVALARALANRPRLVLADEPTANLDRGSGRTALEVLRQTCADHGASLLLVTHDVSVLESFDVRWNLDEINEASPARSRGTRP